MAKSEPKRATRRRIRRRRERSSLQILEEAFHLLRTTPLSSLWLYYLGAVPFVTAFLYFLADMSRSTFASRDAVPAAMMMVAAFFWMKFFQAKFCAALWNTVNPGHSVELKGWQKFRYTAALWCLHAFAMPVLLAGVFFLVPLGWIIAAFQNITVLAFTHNYGRRPFRNLFGQSLRSAHYDWAQNHGILITMAFIGLFMWLNILSTCMILPTFAKSFFGIESMFTTNPEATLQNSTFILGTLLITWMVMSPVMKAVYVIRCFYAESRPTGADLLSRLESCRQQREQLRRSERNQRNTTAAALVIGLGILLSGISTPPLFAAGANPTAGDSVSELKKAISKTMEQKRYQWKIPRNVSAKEEESKGNSWLSRKLNEFAESVDAAGKAILDWIEEFFNQLSKQSRDGHQSGGNTDLDLHGLKSTTSILLIIIVAGLVGWLIFVLVKNYKAQEIVEHDDSGFTGIIDLESDDIIASQLPEDEWMRLAQEQISKGETRLAIRALFLASLAHLGDRGMLKIARFKTNRTYRKELERRVRHREKLREAFDENTSLFERVWYGLHDLGDDAVDHFMVNYDKISQASQSTENPPAA